ncbi:MAG TPA: sigma-70 family RNA polymerase sigma factor [Blastocatellia bacterium]|nr:sigma-70 family RNA polymerase sigma factor [Blastocatellia bacterium]
MQENSYIGCLNLRVCVAKSATIVDFQYGQEHASHLRVLSRTTETEAISKEDDPVEGCRRNDPDAQRRLFNLHKDRVYSLAMFLSKNPADAAEITQEVFLKVYSGLSHFRGEAKLETWLYRIVTNTCSNHARKYRSILSLDFAFWSGRTERVVSAEEELAKRQIDETVRAAVASLPEKLRVPIVLRYVEDLSYEQISEVLNCPAGTVAARLNRANKMLVQKLAKLRR